MEDGKNQIAGQELTATREDDHLQCQVCGRPLQPDAGSWQEDDANGMCCPDCMAEIESCGCSD